MLSKDTSTLSLVAAAILAVVVANAGVGTYNALNKKALEQEAAVSQLREWKRQYAQLIPVEEKWNATLGAFDDAKDLLTIHGLVSHDAPSTNPDKLLVERIGRLTVMNKDIGANKVCVVSSGSSGLLFTEPSFKDLMANLSTLNSRMDIELGTLSLSEEKGQAKAVASPLCILLRDNSV